MLFIISPRFTGNTSARGGCFYGCARDKILLCMTWQIHSLANEKTLRLSCLRIYNIVSTLFPVLTGSRGIDDMSSSGRCNFSRGVGIPYSAVYHLLDGTRKIERKSGKADDDCYYHDENIRGYGRGGGDQEVQEINRMELKLGSLSPALRDMRAMVDFCCIWRYDYPERVHHICRSIGGSGDTLSRCHYQVGTDKRDELAAYARAMKKWLGRKGDQKTMQPGCHDLPVEIEGRVFALLGEREEIKELLVERTMIGLAARHIDCSFFGSDATGKPVAVFPVHAMSLEGDWHSRMKVLEREIQKILGPRSYDFLCEVGGAEPPCHFKFIRRLEILLGSIGCLSWRGCLPPKDARVSGRRQVTEKYLAVLHAYWSGANNASAGSDEHADQCLKEKLFDVLGQPELFRRWLVASLWKNIKNQTQYQAFTMKRWVEFVQIMRRHTPPA